jgi:hypothetical protein
MTRGSLLMTRLGHSVEYFIWNEMVGKGTQILPLAPTQTQKADTERDESSLHELLCLVFFFVLRRRRRKEDEVRSHVRVDNNADGRDIAREPMQDKRDGEYSGLRYRERKATSAGASPRQLGPLPRFTCSSQPS